MNEQKLPGYYWAIAALLLLWGLAGIFAFYSQVSMGPAELAALPPAQREAFAGMPTLVWAIYGIATISGVIGSILLLFRKALARPVYILSLIGVVAQFGWTFTGGRVLELVGPAQAIPFPAVICLIGIFQIWFASLAIRRGWIA
jgi:hypothetical protein